MIYDITLHRDKIIDVSTLKHNSRVLAKGLISPAAEDVPADLAPENKSEPIKSMDDINRICDYLIQSERYRDYMMFVLGINFGLRVSDLSILRFSHLINPNCTFKDRFGIFEKKTRNTRKRKLNRYISINNAVIEAVTLYLEHTPNVSLSDFMFRSVSNNGGNINRPLSRQSINEIIKDVADKLGINAKISTHSLRKTFGYHQMVMSGNDPRKLYLLQKMFGHSSPAQTMDYIGITHEEIDEAYQKLNLGSKMCNYMVGCEILEFSEQVS